MNEQTPLQQAAEELYNGFTRRTRDNGAAFYSTADGALEWVKDAIYEAHGDLLPNDWTYDTAHTIASNLCDQIDEDTDPDDLDDLSGEICDGCVDIYNAERTAWLASNLSRAAFCDDAQSEGLVGSGDDIFARIGVGQYMEARQIFGALVEEMRNRAAYIESARENAAA